MALSPSCLQLFAESALPLAGSRREAIVLGYPDIGDTSPAVLSRIFGVDVPESSLASALRAVGFEKTSVLDVSSYEGADVVADLGVPLDATEHFGRYDLIVDNGTLEHVFNIGQAFFNCKRLCALGGVIFHMNPWNLSNHGFWNLSPCTYFDFYEANGFECRVWLRDTTTGRYAEIEYKPKVTTIPPARRHTIHCVAWKVRETPNVAPIQRRWSASHGV